MHLKKIEIQGFKSFADKIEIKFKNGITAIVGPNGSGKSNISDAIKWVLGEQSVKSLRGSKMEDVIFAGTDTRKPLGYTEVSITFDNKKGVIPVDYQEVAITRRMFRSGESEYYLNKNSCRLKDIKELFMDTGVGTDGYSIIGQGKIDEILSSRPEDRRSIFEEASGIVKYKTKKTEAEKKLKKTDENLERIKDIVIELQNQFNSLEKQSSKANIYIKLSEELKILEINLYIREIDKIEKKMKESMKNKKEFQLTIDKILNEKNKIENNLTLMNVEAEQMDKDINTIQSKKIKTMNNLNENKNKIKILNEKEKYNIKDTQRLEKEIEDLTTEIQKIQNNKINLISEKGKNTKKLEIIKENLESKNIVLNKLNTEINSSESIIEKIKNENINLYNEIVDKKSKINGLISFEKNINKRTIQIEKNIKNLIDQNKKTKESLEGIEKNELKQDKQIIKYNKFSMSAKMDIEEDRNKLNNIIKEINQNKIDLQDRISNFNLLKNMEEDYEGYYKSVKNLILASKKEETLKDKVIGIIADLIKVDKNYEKAINVALGGRLQNVVTKDENDAKIIIDYLRKRKLGRVTFLPISTIKGRIINISDNDRREHEILGLGSELISFNEMYRNIIEFLLGRTIIVKDLNRANKVAKQFNYSFRIVTLEGDIINSGGSITGGSLPKISGNLLNRKHRIETLKKEIDDLSKIQKDLEKRKINIQLYSEKNIEKLKSQEKKLNNINIEIVKTENEKNQYKSELKRTHKSIEGYKNEIKELKSELIKIYDDKEKLTNDIFELDKKNKLLKENIKEKELDFNDKKQIKINIEKEVTDIKIELSLLENKLTNKLASIKTIKNQIISKSKLKRNKKEELSRSKQNISGNFNETSNLRESIEEILKLEQEQEEKFNLLKSKKSNFMKTYHHEQDKLKEINNKLGETEKQKNKWEVAEAKLNVELENVNMRLLEDYELVYYEALELLIEIEDYNHTSEKVKELNSEIKKLGTINLGSIEEYKSVSERLDFIMKQYKDLLKAKEDLQQVITNMESKMEKQFSDNFNQINECFNNIFSVLFDGGKAELILEDEDNILDCGIEIQAQPPGKKLQNLSLLSGGEKSLAAVALLFSILQMRPTPFCVLDEIDASLDDANINRYTNYLKSFSKETQFIMITHRKSTMEMADVLYGVTMEEKGISKMISVKLTDDLEEEVS